MTVEKPLPCPFCGAAPVLHTETSFSTLETGGYVGCSHNSDIPMKPIRTWLCVPPEEAVRIWNTRSANDQ